MILIATRYWGMILLLHGEFLLSRFSDANIYHRGRLRIHLLYQIKHIRFIVFLVLYAWAAIMMKSVVFGSSL
jgi:hypothetical protein